MLIFISHSKMDEELTTVLIRFIVTALKIDRDQIRCTSVPGYKLPMGAHTSTTLRYDIDSTAAFIGILTKNSLTSSYVLFELGARWGAGKRILPLLGPNMKYSDIDPPLKENHLARLNDRDDLLQLLDELEQVTGCQTNNKNIVDNAVNELSTWISHYREIETPPIFSPNASEKTYLWHGIEWTLTSEFWRNYRYHLVNEISAGFLKACITGPFCSGCKRDVTNVISKLSANQCPHCETKFNLRPFQKDRVSAGDAILPLRQHVFREAQAAAKRNEI